MTWEYLAVGTLALILVLMATYLGRVAAKVKALGRRIEQLERPQAKT